MGRDDYSTDPDQVYQDYSNLPSRQISIPPLPGATAISTLAGLTGPTIKLDGGSTGFTFNPAGITITLQGPLTTKGDLYVRNSTVGTRLAAAANDARLTTDSAEATGLKWIAASTGWSALTGSVDRGAHATYSGTASVGYVQAELQAVMDALKWATERLKAATDDLLGQKVFKA